MLQAAAQTCKQDDGEKMESRDGTVVEHLPPTNVARVRFPDSASYVD